MNWLIDAFLIAALLVLSIGVIGMMRMRTPLDRLHFMGVPVSMGGALVVAAIAVHNGPSEALWKAIIAWLIMLVANTMSSHATARAVWNRDGSPLSEDVEEAD